MGNPRRGFPLFFWVCTCAPIRWEGVVSLSCHSTPFLWCLPKETVSSRQRKALFYPGGSTIRVSAPASVVGTFLARLGAEVGAGRGLMRDGDDACMVLPQILPPIIFLGLTDDPRPRR